MAKANLLYSSMESASPIQEDVHVNSTGQVHSASTGQVLAHPLPLKEAFSSLYWFPPDQRASRQRVCPQL